MGCIGFLKGPHGAGKPIGKCRVWCGSLRHLRGSAAGPSLPPAPGAAAAAGGKAGTAGMWRQGWLSGLQRVCHGSDAGGAGLLLPSENRCVGARGRRAAVQRGKGGQCWCRAPHKQPAPVWQQGGTWPQKSSPQGGACTRVSFPCAPAAGTRWRQGVWLALAASPAAGVLPYAALAPFLREPQGRGTQSAST